MSLVRREGEKLKKTIAERLEPTAKKIRVLKLYALGPNDTHTLMRWMKEGSLLEDLLKENMELRGRYINLEARLTVLADRVCVEKLEKIFRAAREVVRQPTAAVARREGEG